MTIASITPMQIRTVRFLISGGPIDKSMINRKNELDVRCIRPFHVPRLIFQGTPNLSTTMA
jgi:hypothetical protein